MKDSADEFGMEWTSYSVSGRCALVLQPERVAVLPPNRRHSGKLTTSSKRRLSPASFLSAAAASRSQRRRRCFRLASDRPASASAVLCYREVILPGCYSFFACINHEPRGFYPTNTNSVDCNHCHLQRTHPKYSISKFLLC